MKIAIMQPYFFPYIGYFQLINYVDKFVIYDTIQYTKKGWINRNRILSKKENDYINISLKKDSDYLNVSERFVSENWIKDKLKLKNKIKGTYSKAPYFKETFELVEECLNSTETNLFKLLYFILVKVCKKLNIKTEIIISSSLNLNEELKSTEKIIEICNKLQAKEYFNPIGGLGLYSKEFFLEKDIKLSFLKTKKTSYTQFESEFIPFLSIIDVLMFNTPTEVNNILNNQFELI